MRKILILTDTVVGGTTGGAETHILNLLRGIDQSSYSVDVIYFDTDADDDDVDTSTREMTEIEGIHFQRVPIRRVYAPSAFKHLKKIYKIMKAGNYDCVMSFFESSDMVASTVGYLAGIEMRVSNRRDTGFRNSKKLAFTYRVVNKLFTNFIAVSSAVKDSIIEQGADPEKIKVIYNAVDLKRFDNLNGAGIRKELGIEPDEQIFGMVANLYPVKNHSSVLEALAILHKEDRKAHLVLAGEGQLREELEQHASNLNLQSYIHFLGPRNDVEDVLDSIDTFILASHTEGLSNALLEAMAAKKPVIASRVGGNVEVVEEGVDGILVSTETESIAAAMKKLFDSKTLRLEMGQKAYEHIKRQFSFEQMLETYMSVIDAADNELKQQTSSVI